MELYNMPNRLFTKKLLGTIDQEEEQEFQKLMDNNSDIRKEFSFAQKIWKEARNVKVFEGIDSRADWKTVNLQIHSTFELKYKPIPWGSYFIRIAAVVILSCGLSIGFYKMLTSQKSESTGFISYNALEHKTEIMLPDGSSVTLNKGSQLTFRDGFGTNSRDVILNGEAFFSVIPGSALPFKVFSGGSVVEVTGTKFSVREINGEVHVSVISGTVVLSSKTNSDKKVSIVANQSGYLLPDENVTVEDGIPVNSLSWKTGHLVFDQTPIDSALSDIAHHFNRELSIKTNLDDKITAEFQNQPLFEILEEIKLVAGLQFDTTGTALIVRK